MKKVHVTRAHTQTVVQGSVGGLNKALCRGDFSA